MLKTYFLHSFMYTGVHTCPGACGRRGQLLWPVVLGQNSGSQHWRQASLLAWKGKFYKTGQQLRVNFPTQYQWREEEEVASEGRRTKWCGLNFRPWIKHLINNQTLIASLYLWRIWQHNIKILKSSVKFLNFWNSNFILKT